MTRRVVAAAAALLLTACGADPGVRTETAEQVSVDRTTLAIEPPATTPQPTTNESTPVESSLESSVPLDDTGDGVGDALFPELGNPGLDVQHYDVALAYDPTADAIGGTVGLDVMLTSDRAEITLDAAGPVVSQVTVDGVEATAVADGPELRITLPQPGKSGDELRIEVAYSQDVSPLTSAVGLPSGWFNTPGGSYVLNEPDGARTWLPSNDHPSDKATYKFTLTVPAGVTAVANGALADHRTEAGQEVWVWQQRRPMATYLIQLLTGDYELVDGVGPHGLPLLSAILRDDRATMQPFLDVTPEMIEFFEQYFGRYPLDRYGLAMTDSFSGLAMETQERSLFSRDDFAGGQLGSTEHLLLAHELAHQWFGNAISPARWQDIWLGESFATYGQWMWFEEAGLRSVQESAADALFARPPGSTADPGLDDMFGYNSYDGGAVVVHALRLTVGDATFFQILQRWVTDNNGTSRTTADFVALAQDVAGQSLTDFFDTWLFADIPPAEYPTPA